MAVVSSGSLEEFKKAQSNEERLTIEFDGLQIRSFAPGVG